MLAVAIIDQGVEAGHGFRHHVAAAAAVAAVGAAELDEFLAAERDAAVATVAGPDLDSRLVEKFHGGELVNRVIKRGNPRFRSARPPFASLPP